MNQAEKIEKGAEAVNELLHFGVRGMKWGIRRNRNVPTGPVKTSITRTDRGRVKITTTGGGKSSASVDAIRYAQAQQKFKKSGIASLSNSELKALTQRAELEGKMNNIADTRINTAKRQLKTIQTGTTAVKTILAAAGTVGAVIAFHNSPNGKLIEGIVKKGLARA